MDRTVCLNSDFFFFDGIKAPSVFNTVFSGRTELPKKSDSGCFTLVKKIICPKQINDTVTVCFSGEYESIRLFAGKQELSPAGMTDEKACFDITPALKTGKTVLTAHVYGGGADGFFLSVKRDYGNKK